MNSLEPEHVWIDHIPAIFIKPPSPQPIRRLAIFLAGLSGNKENNIPFLADLARAGFYALSFDNWEHGERTTLNSEQIITRTFSNFRRHIWVTIGQSALDALRVIDWAISNLQVEPRVCMGGVSMGGDIAITAAGIDPRVRRVAAVGATPDWLRPGMLDLRCPEPTILPQGTPDAYARFFYEKFNPITHLAQYAHAPEIHFINGETDTHVPPEAAFRFKAGLTELYPQAAEAVTVRMIPGQDHIGVCRSSEQWWPELAAWLARPF